jgi:hypothetical protein
MRCYGYDETGSTVVDHEAAVIRDIATRVLAGESLRSLVADLRQRELLTSGRRPWTQQTLSRLLRNPRLAGLRTRGGEVVGPGPWPAILDNDTHERLVALLSDPARQQPNGSNQRKYLLTGLLFCANEIPDPETGGTRICGKPLYTQPSNSGKRGYVCRSGSPSYGCGRIRIAAASLEEETGVRALGRLASPQVRTRLERAAALGPLDTTQVEAHLAALDTRLDEAGREFARGRLSTRTLNAIEDEIRRERKAMAERQSQVERLQTVPIAAPEALATWWVDASIDRRRELLLVVLDRINIKPASRLGFIRFDEDRIEYVWK